MNGVRYSASAYIIFCNRILLVIIKAICPAMFSTGNDNIDLDKLLIANLKSLD